jgi:hypothetical protein
MTEPQMVDLEVMTRCCGLIEEAIEEASLLDDFLAENVMAALISEKPLLQLRSVNRQALRQSAP